MPLVHVVFDSAEGVLSKLFAQLHFLRAELHPLLHFLHDLFVAPAADPASSLAAGALRLEGAITAGAGGVVASNAALLFALKSKCQLLFGGTPVAVELGIVAEVILCK